MSAVEDEDYPTGREERILLMEEAIDNLQPDEQLLIHLYYYEDVSTYEIARILEKKESTVRSLLRRARGILKEIIE